MIEPLSHPLNPIPDVKKMVKRNHINVLSYNLFLRPPFIKNNLSDHKDDRLEDFIRLLPEFDIVCIEEMFGLFNSRKEKFIDCAKKAGFLYHAKAENPSFFTTFVVDAGLCVISRYFLYEFSLTLDFQFLTLNLNPSPMEFYLILCAKKVFSIFKSKSKTM
jgi:hypothetical protein